MTGVEEAWFERSRVDWVEANRIADGTTGIRDAIYGLWRAMAAAPLNVRDLYRGIDEESLMSAAADVASRQSLPELPSPYPDNAARDATFTALAVGLRALELKLAGLADGGTLRRGQQCLASFGGDRAYVVPIRPRHRRAATRHPFARRALVGLRVLPLSHMGVNVRVRFQEDPNRQCGDPNEDLPMAAALFPGLVFDVEDTSGGFRIRGANSADHLGVIERALRSADASGCLALTLPELTVDDATLAAVRTKMGDGTWVLEKLGVFVAGSRHADVGGGRFVNVATVLDRYGADVAEHRKLFRYSDGAGPHEDIALGDTIEVLVTTEAILAFGICLDFCNRTEPSPYPWLDVDYVIVPSCGGLTTMRGHVERSNELLQVMKTRSMVVQQHYGDHPSDAPPLGYVLARREGEPPSVDELATSDDWIMARL
ncbi:hypothetical protein ACQKQD_31500 [Methylobacterium sp. NPDC080182]|uniref:hypothetical protein n=1 Tax=Methylobacterium sp. NPDC080182 TaxID=3390590 RepID=UPI003CFEFED5